MNDNIRVTVNSVELPIINGKVTFKSSPVVELHRSAHDWNAAIKRLREPTTITWTIYPEEPYQPTGPIVEGSVEPLQG